MKRLTLKAFCGCVAVSLALCASIAHAVGDAESGDWCRANIIDGYAAEIIHVVDGDTLDVRISLGLGISIDRARLRIEGVNTPEITARNKRPDEYRAGIAARDFVNEWVARRNNGEVCLSASGRRDSFGRLLGDVWPRRPMSTNLGYQLRKAGHDWSNR